MACKYTLTQDGKEITFDSKAALRAHLEKSKLQDAHDIPETFEGQRDQFVSRWKLTLTNRFGQYGYTSIGAQKATMELARKMAKQLSDKSSGIYDKLSIQYDSTHGLIKIRPDVKDGGDFSGPQYDINNNEDSEPDPKGAARQFKPLPRDFKMSPGDTSKYFLTTASVGKNTYVHQGEYFNVEKTRNGNAQQLARHLGVSVDMLKEKIKSSNLQPSFLKDFLEGKNSLKLNLYKVDRVSDADQFIDPNEDKTIGDFRRAKILQRTRLQEALKQNPDPARRADLYKELARVKKQIQQLNKAANQSIAYIKQSFLDDKEVYSTKEFKKAKDIDHAYHLFNGYEVLFKSIDLKPFGEEVAKEFKEHLSDIRELKEKFVDMKNKTALDEMQLKANAVLANEDGNLLAVKDINAFGAWALAMSTTQRNPLIAYIGRTTNFAVNKAKDKTTEKKDEIKKIVTELQKWGKASGLKGHKLYDYMLEEDESGNSTGNFVIKYGNFYNNLGRALKSIEKHGPGEFMRTIKDNVDSVEILHEAFAAEREKIYNNKATQLRQANPDMSDEDVHNQSTSETNRISYGIDPENFTRLLEKVKDGKKLDDKDNAFITDFINRNAYYKYIKLHPKDENRDKKYMAIEALPDTDPRKQFYNLFAEFHYEIREKMPHDGQTALRRNFIAEYHRDYKDEDESLGDYLKSTIKDWTLQQFTESPRDNISGQDPITGEITRSIPFYAFDGRMTPDSKSYNLGKVLGVLAQQYYKYEMLSEVEDDLLLAQHILKQTPVYEVNSFGKPIMINGEPVIKTDTSSMYKQVDAHILSIVYGERMAKDGIGENKHYDLKTARRIQELDELAQEQPDGLTAEQEDEYRKLKANFTSVTVKKVTNSLMAWTSIKNIGFNLFGGLAEIFQGTSSLYLRYGGKEWFNTVFPTLLQLMNPTDSAAKHKFSNLRRIFHVESDPNPNMDDSKIKNIAYKPYAIARVMANSGYLIAILKEQKIKDREGVEHPLIDVIDFDQDNKLVVPDGFDNPFYEKDGKTWSEYKYKLQQIVNKEIKQNRDRESDIDPIQGDKHFWGRLLGQFKFSWLFEGMAMRFGSEQAPLNDLDKASKGIYRSFWDLSKVYQEKTNALGEVERSFSAIRTIFNAMTNIAKFSSIGRRTAWGKQHDESDLEYQGAVRAVREVQSALFLYGFVMLMSGLAHGDDKDKWKKMGLIYAANYFMRTSRDMSTYFDPNSLTSIVNKNVIPSLGTVDEAIKLIEDPFSGIFRGNWYYNQGKDSQSFKMTRDAADLVPFMNQVRMTMNKMQKQQGIFY